MRPSTVFMPLISLEEPPSKNNVNVISLRRAIPNALLITWRHVSFGCTMDSLLKRHKELLQEPGVGSNFHFDEFERYMGDVGRD